MSLNFDLSAIPLETRTQIAAADRPMDDIKKGDRIMHPVTNALIWATMSVGMNSITEENVLAFWDRMRMQQKLFGAELRQGDGTPYFISFDEVRANIGMKTNANNHPDVKWLKLTMTSHVAEVARERLAAEREASEREASKGLAHDTAKVA